MSMSENTLTSEGCSLLEEEESSDMYPHIRIQHVWGICMPPCVPT